MAHPILQPLPVLDLNNHAGSDPLAERLAAPPLPKNVSQKRNAGRRRLLGGGFYRDSIAAARMAGELGDNRNRYRDAAIAQCAAGTASVTRASGTSRTVHVRRACIHPLRETMWHFAFCSTTHCAWAKAYYRAARGRGKRHAQAIRMLGNVWLRIIIAMRRNHRLYDQAMFLNAREAHLSLAS